MRLPTGRCAWYGRAERDRTRPAFHEYQSAGKCRGMEVRNRITPRMPEHDGTGLDPIEQELRHPREVGDAGTSPHASVPPTACSASRASIATPTASSATETKRFIARLDTRWAMRAPSHTPPISSTETAAATVKSIVP